MIVGPDLRPGTRPTWTRPIGKGRRGPVGSAREQPPRGSTPRPASSCASRAARARASPRSPSCSSGWLRDEGYAVRLTFEPGDTEVGRRVRQIVLDPATGELSDRTEALLYAADKAEHVDTIVLPALDRGEVVITDRYVDSLLAYQGAGRALDVAERRAGRPLGDRRPAAAPDGAARPRAGARPGPVRGARPDRGRVRGVPPAGARRRSSTSPPPTPTTTSSSTPAPPVDEIAAAVRERVRPLLGQATR